MIPLLNLPRSVFKIMSGTYDRIFEKNNLHVKAVKCFYKTLHHIELTVP